jgi:hypothetical protein
VVRLQNSPLSSSNGSITISTTAINLAYRNASSQSNLLSIQNGVMDFSPGSLGISSFQVNATGVISGDATTQDRILLTPVAKGTTTFDGTITTADLTGAQSWTFPDATGNVALSTGPTGCTTPPFSFSADTDAGLCLAAVDQPKIQSGASGNSRSVSSWGVGGISHTYVNASAVNTALSVSDMNVYVYISGLAQHTFSTGSIIAGNTNPGNHDVLELLPGAAGAGSFKGSFTSADLTGNRTWTLPNATGNIGLTVATVFPQTGTASTTAAQSGYVITNTGDSDGSINNLLDDPTAGVNYLFVITAAQTMTIAPATGETFYDGADQCVVSLTSSTVGSSVEVIAVTGGSGAIWVARKIGTWTCNDA